MYNNMSHNLNNTSFADASIFQDVTRSVDQLCQQLSLANIKIPRTSDFDDIHDFLSAYEEATTNLSESQRLKFVHKAFKNGRHMAWFETVLKPKIQGGSSWSDVKATIKSRFCGTDERDAHLERVRELRFTPNGHQKLLEFVEELVYSINKAMPRSDQEERMRFIKASLPNDLRSQLNIYSEYRNAKSIEDIKLAAKQYDESKMCWTGSRQTMVKAEDMATMLKTLIDNVKQEVRKEVIAAVATHRPMSPRRDYRDSRSPSRQSLTKDYARSHSPGQQANRAPSPRPIQMHSNQHQDSVNSQDNIIKQPFDVDKYYTRFGMPPSPCTACGLYHWSRHCSHFNVESLN